MRPIGNSASAAAVMEPSAFDREAAAAFLRAQASWLRRGLQLRADQVEVALVLSTHDASHAAWVNLVAAVERTMGEDAAQQIAVLYALHGRVAGSLERGFDALLDEAVREQVTHMLRERLTAMTEQAATLLNA